MGGAGTHAGEDAVKRVREQLRARGQLAHAVAARDVVRVALVVLAKELDAVHVARHARRDVVVAVETDRTVRDCFRAGILVRQETGNLSMMIRTFVCLVC